MKPILLQQATELTLALGGYERFFCDSTTTEGNQQ